MKIIAYLKPACGWSQGVRAALRKYDLPFEDRDIIGDPAQREEMMQKSGQRLSPCVEIEGEMLADVSGAEVEEFLLRHGLVEPTDKEAEAPIDRSCMNEPARPRCQDVMAAADLAQLGAAQARRISVDSPPRPWDAA